MKNLVFDFFKEYHFLKLADLAALYKITSLKTYPTGTLIARQGQTFHFTIGIRQGIIRTYILMPNGDERTVRFAREGHFASCSRSLLHNQPSNEFLEVVEEAKVILIDTTKLKELTHNNPQLLRMWSLALSAAFSDSIERIEFFTTLNPEERYRYILRESPELIHRVPQKYLASYIGVTTVSLSRIKSRAHPKSS